MTRLTARAPSKVNACLFLGPVRASDGRHELVSVVQSVSLADELELTPAPAGTRADVVHCPGVAGPNLAAAALAAFRAATGWDAPPQQILINKQIPVAAGMGGGSCDAAATLRLAAAASGLGDVGLLAELAAALGADVPAQVRPGRSLVTGAGERVRRLADPDPFGLLVMPAAEPLSTAAVFAEADRIGLGRDAHALADRRGEIETALDRDPGSLPAGLLVNDLEPAACSLCPAIPENLGLLTDAGADLAMVSGSGPTVVGWFWGRRGPAAAQEAARTLGESRPGVVAAGPVGEGFGTPAVEPVRHN